MEVHAGSKTYLLIGCAVTKAWRPLKCGTPGKYLTFWILSFLFLFFSFFFFFLAFFSGAAPMAYRGSQVGV